MQWRISHTRKCNSNSMFAEKKYISHPENICYLSSEMIHSRECNESTKILLISHKTHQYTRVTTLVLTLDTEGMTDSNLRGSFSSARPGHISSDSTCRGNAPHIISRPAPAGRGERGIGLVRHKTSGHY